MDNTINVKIKHLCDEVLSFSRNIILVNYRFLDSALSRLEPMRQELITFGTDGKNLFYMPEYLLKRYIESSDFTVHDYMHTLFHCIFRHNFIDPHVDRKLWNIACDIAVENVLQDIEAHSSCTEKNSKRVNKIMKLRADFPLLTAEKVYNRFRSAPPDQERLDELADIFISDDHRAWYMTENQKEAISMTDENGTDNYDTRNENGRSLDNDAEINIDSKRDYTGYNAQPDTISEEFDGRFDYGNGSNSSTQIGSYEDWKEISERIQVYMETISPKQGNVSSALVQELMALNREKCDYTAFLKKFAVMGEAMKVNDDEFDYNFYTYGLSIYKNMPLIESLEYKEIKRIREFVIAIDTSGSVKGDLVQNFLQKTYNIIKQTESFFSKINLHIIQCDADIQEHIKLTSQEEYDNYIKNMKIHGFGGTDFRPVFEVVDKLILEKEFTNLKGLIYFTDGYGKFPLRKPIYETAFVFVKEDCESPDVPPWAIKLILEKEDIL